MKIYLNKFISLLLIFRDKEQNIYHLIMQEVLE